MNLEFRFNKAHAILVKNIFDFVVRFESEERFDEYDLRLYDLTKESIKNLDKLPNVVEFANDIISTLEINHPEIKHYDYWRHFNLLVQQVELLGPIAEKMINDEDFKQEIIQNGFKIIEDDFWESKIKKRANSSPIVSNFSPGTLDHLENSLIHIIYEQIIKNPTRYHKESPGITQQRKKAIKKRDKYICQICNEKFEEEELQVDHIFPYGAGGSNEETNLMSLCEKCNRYKSDSPEYYRSEEGRFKVMENIKEFVKTLPMIHDFGDWLEKMGDKRRRI